MLGLVEKMNRTLMNYDSKEMQLLKIYTMFMYSDGEASESEVTFLDDIAEKLIISDADFKEIEDFCDQVDSKLSTDNPETFIEEIDKVLSKVTYGGIDTSKTEQTRTILTLINLEYADNEYCKAEKEVVNHLVERWDMDPLLVAELNDTVETILALTKHKEWLQTTSRPYKGIEETIYEIDRNIVSLFENVEISISEADIG